MRAIDADKLLREMPKDDVLLSGDVRRMVVDAPTLDIAPVIRCRECKYAKYEIGCEPLHWCNAFYGWIQGENAYCHKAERKDAGQEGENDG